MGAVAICLKELAAPQGFEPRYADPESAVLPLNEGAAKQWVGWRNFLRHFLILWALRASVNNHAGALRQFRLSTIPSDKGQFPLRHRQELRALCSRRARILGGTSEPEESPLMTCLGSMTREATDY